MRFFKLSYELITDTNITSNEFRIYTYLMSLHNEMQGCSFPSMDKIVEKTNISLATVKRSIKRLVELGYMTVEKQKAKIGNFNKYKNFKYLVNSTEKDNSTEDINKEMTTKKIVEDQESNTKPLIVADCKESGVQIAIEEISQFTIEHQQKISLILKQGIILTEKQKFLVGDMDLETLRKAIHQFKKKKGKYFSLLLSLYIDQAEKVGVYVSRDIEKFLKGNFVRLIPEERETQEALRELEMYGVPYGA